MSEQEEMYITPQATLHILEDIDQLAESGNADANILRALIKEGFIEIFDAYVLLFEKGLVGIDSWEERE